MVIIRTELLLEKKEVQNELSLLLKRVSHFSRISMDIVEFHTKSISCFGVLSSTYLIAQKFSLLELQMNYLSCPYDIQEKTGSHVQEK